MKVNRASRRRGDDTGFTLTELLVVISILGIIGYPLTESVILGLKTTDATAASSSRSVATQTLSSYFTGDAQSADKVETANPTAPCAPGFIHLTWKDQEAGLRKVSYSLTPTAPTPAAPAPEQELVRWSCTGSSTPDSKVLGQFSRVPDPSSAAVQAECVGATCTSIRLTVQSDPTLTLTVSRRVS